MRMVSRQVIRDNPAMATTLSRDPRAATNPLFNDNRFKLGTFATNVSGAAAISTIDGSFETTWPATKRLARMADAAGFEALVPVARWRGFGGETNFNGASFETYTWAAGLGAATERCCVFSTSHVPTVHPIVAAKQATTIDHISNGRFALNVVCGWFGPELEMFGAPLMEHEQRYDYATEWLTVVKRLWTAEEEFDFEGRFFKIKKGFHQPKPIQRPFPPVMNAGGSVTGQKFVAEHGDMAFTILTSHDMEAARAQVARLKDLARKEHGREIQVWTHSYVVQGDTEEDARKFLDHYVREKGDPVAVDNLLGNMGLVQSARFGSPEAKERFKQHFAAGYGGFPLVGTAEQIVDGMQRLSKVGLDGSLVHFARYEEGLARFVSEIMPLMEQAGLRRPNSDK
jgi:alkanesulfonate monooxygenase SsuD/methylene tetrahydromethanopterin reductase-like flavin-dependent oxidoreductase (luciferase family)